MSMPFRILSLLVLLVGVAGAEIPDTFRNLEVLPADTEKQVLIDVMRDFSTALGVRCSHCHIQATPGDFDSYDWVSDDLEPKRTARGMMRLVEAVNGDLLPAAGRDGEMVSCVTCHRGLIDPKPLDQVLRATLEAEGVDAALAEYRDLHAVYYGSGSYDFGVGTLGGLALDLAEKKGDQAGAEAACDLNVEYHADAPEAWLLRAQFLGRAERTEEALADVRKALEIDPQNRRARQLLERLGG